MSTARVAPEEKIRLVELWLSGECSQQKCADMAGVTKTAFQHWVRSYKIFGPKGLYRETNRKYPDAKKNAAIAEYLEGNTSQEEICRKYNISSVALLYKWIRAHQGREKVNEDLSTGRKTTYEERLEAVRWCLANDNDYVQSARQFNVSYNQIYYWVQRYLEKGEQVLDFKAPNT